MSNVLLINSAKTEVIVFSSKHLRNRLADFTLASSTTVKNLGVIFDQDMLFKQHINQVCKTAFFHLRNNSKIKSILHQGDADKLIHAFVSSLDYCNAKNLLNSFQLIQNAAAQVLTGIRKRDNVSPVKFRIKFKILLLVYKALNGRAPYYL